MRRRKLLIIAGALFGLFLLLVCLAVAYVFFADLSGYREAAAQVASDAIGRRLRIDGDFDLEIGGTSSLVVGDVALANPDWCDEPEMVTVERAAVSLDLWSLFRGPIRVQRIELSGVRVWLEKDGEGRASWDFETGASGDDGKESTPRQLILEDVALSDLDLSLVDPARSEPLHARVEQLGVRSDESGMLDLGLEGAFNRAPLILEGRLGPLMGLIQGTAVEHQLRGRFAEMELASSGRFGELFALEGVHLSASLSGSSTETVGERFGVNGLPDGPFGVQVEIKPQDTDHRVRVEFGAVGSQVSAQSIVDSLKDPSMLDVEVAGAGPDVAAIAAVLGLANVQPEPFEVSGRVRWQGFPVRFDDVELRVGANTLSVDGVVGAPPRMLATDFTFSGTGPDLSALAAVVGVALPSREYSLSGRVLRREGGIQVEDMEVRVGRSSLQAQGYVGDPPAYDGTDLQFHAAGPRLADFRALAGVDLPASSFSLDGRLSRGDGTINLDGVRARVGNATLHVNGGLVTSARLIGTDLRAKLSSPDPSWVGALFGTELVPAEPLAARVRVVVGRQGFGFKEVTATLGEILLRADGVVGRARGLVGTDLSLRMEGPEASRLAGITRLHALPRDPFTIAGGLEVADGALVLNDVKAVVGSVDLQADGRIALSPGIVGSTIRVRGKGSHLGDFGDYLNQPGWPDEPFAVRGTVHVAEGQYDFERVVATVARNTAEVSGSFVTTSGLVGSDFDLDLRGPELAELGELVVQSNLAELPPLPAEPYSLMAQVAVELEHYNVKWLEAKLGPAKATFTGTVGLPPSFAGTDLTVVSDGPNGSLFSAMTGITVPAAPFQLNGRMQRLEGSSRLDSVSVRIGEYAANFSGTLGDPPLLIGTNLDLTAAGPSLTLVEELAGLESLPFGAFSVSGHFEGTPEQFQVQGLQARLGDSDIAGSIRVDLQGPPDLSGELRSNRLDVAALLGPATADDSDAPEAENPTPVPSASGYVISDRVLDLGFLSRASGALVYRIDDLLLPRAQFQDVDINVRLEDGGVQIGPFHATGEHGGRLEAHMEIEPAGEGYRVDAGFDLAHAKFDLSASDDDPSQWPTFDVSVAFDGEGRSPHEMASRGDGRLQVVVGEGTMDNALLDLLTADIMRELLLAFNPFSGEKSMTMFNCAVMVVAVEDGQATLDPFAMQTETMTVVGSGLINLATEELDVEWVTKPRKGIGLSASAITNPYIKVGGTLARPGIEIKPMQAVAATGVAVATAGLSLLGKGFWDRLTAERKVCKRALERAAKNAPPPR